jgi:hypothetical protein
MNIIEKNLTLGTLFSQPKIEGKILVDNLQEITDEIIARREEIYPGCMDVEKDEDFDYITKDWWSYHDYVCMDVFPKLKFLFPTIVECLDAVGDDYRKYFFKSWINIWPNKQSINPHVHYGEWHGYYVLRDTGTVTYYTDGIDPEKRKVIPLTNFDGHFVFMPANILHWAQKNPKKDLRLSMGFNLSSWDEVLREERDNAHGRGSKIRNIVLPLSDYI